MAKQHTEYVCQECGARFPKWMGRCPKCGAWNSLEEVVVTSEPERSASTFVAGETAQPQPITAITTDEWRRFSVPNGELQRVLGGGIVPGSGILIGGDPGIGKSTLLLQLADMIAEQGLVLYVSAEESAHQVKLRADRLGVHHENLRLLPETQLSHILHHVEQMQPRLVVVDSIQAIYSDQLQSAAGTVSQVRACAAALLRLCKTSNISLFLVGHVTKEGAIAGPRVLEHMVDAVLYLEGERFQTYRVLRSVKNRFGSTNEVGIFKMETNGMVEVPNPSEIFLAERLPNASGSAIAVTMEGTRPILLEVQALVSDSSFSQPRRTTNGVDFTRLLLITAVLAKRVGVALSNRDVFVNIVGGLHVNEPAADLAVAVAIASSARNRPVQSDLALVGEVGLSGELRSVGQINRRLHEAAKLGFKKVLVPRLGRSQRSGILPDSIDIVEVRTLRQAVSAALLSQ